MSRAQGKVVVGAIRAICAQRRTLVYEPLFVDDDAERGWRVTHVRTPGTDCFRLTLYPPPSECLPGQAMVLVTEEHLKAHLRQWKRHNDCATSLQRAWRLHRLVALTRLLMHLKQRLPAALCSVARGLPRGPRLVLRNIGPTREGGSSSMLWPLCVPVEPLAAPATLQWSREHMRCIQKQLGGSFAEDLGRMSSLQGLELWDGDVFDAGVLFSVFGFHHESVFVSIASLVSAEPRCGSGGHLVDLLHRMTIEVPNPVLGCQSVPSALPFWTTKMEFQRIPAYDLLLDEQIAHFGGVRYPGSTFVVR